MPYPLRRWILLRSTAGWLMLYYAWGQGKSKIFYLTVLKLPPAEFSTYLLWEILSTLPHFQFFCWHPWKIGLKITCGSIMSLLPFMLCLMVMCIISLCSLQITPACNLPLKSLRGGGKIIIVNLQVLPLSSKMNSLPTLGGVGGRRGRKSALRAQS